MNFQNKFKETILVTGAAGFIGSAIVLRLIENGATVIGIDNLNNYYDKKLKIARLEVIKEKALANNAKWTFFKVDLLDFSELKKIFDIYLPKIVFNLAAQAGVRYSINNPSSYINSNIIGFANVLELCRQSQVANLIYASSSSVYGANIKIPIKRKIL